MHIQEANIRKKIKLFKCACLVILIPLGITTSCILPTSPDSVSSPYPDVSGSYYFKYSYFAHSSAGYVQGSGWIDPVKIKQDGPSISVGDKCSGTIEENGEIYFEGNLIPGKGNQKYTGTYDGETRMISGKFRGTVGYGEPPDDELLRVENTKFSLEKK